MSDLAVMCHEMHMRPSEVLDWYEWEWRLMAEYFTARAEEAAMAEAEAKARAGLRNG